MLEFWGPGKRDERRSPALYGDTVEFAEGEVTDRRREDREGGGSSLGGGPRNRSGWRVLGIGAAGWPLRLLSASCLASLLLVSASPDSPQANRLAAHSFCFVHFGKS